MKNIALVSILATLLITGCSYGPKVVENRHNFSVTEKSIIESETELKKYDINVLYPTLQNRGYDVEEINKLIEDQILVFVDGFRNNLLDWDDSFVSEGVFNSLDMSYEIKLLDEKYLSIEYVVSEYFAGAAHPMNFIFSINFDLISNKIVELSDLFAGTEEEYLPTVAELVTAELRKEFTNIEMPIEMMYTEGIEPTLDNFGNFNLVEQGFQFNFSPYHVAPYAAGEFRILIPYENLNNLIIK